MKGVLQFLKFMPKVWKVSPKHSDDLLEQLLVNRGLKNKSEIERFLHPKLEDYEEDFKIPGIEEAKKRILQAVKEQELIIIYGDYDVDGVCGTSVLYHGLASLGAKVLPYIPHREKEGYGLSKEGLQVVKEKGAGLVITVDNGIVALEQAKFAKGLGLDLIITDHHLPLEEKPQCLALVHSTKICGTAVGWCLIKSLVSKELAEELLDLVGVATICDLVPLLEVNRALSTASLVQLNKTTRPGLLALFYEAKIALGEIDSYRVGHILGPRLNAIGRLEHAIDSVRLLCTKDKLKARNLARLLCEANDQKKQLSVQATLEAKEMIAQERGLHLDETTKWKKIIVLQSEKWIPGIIGLIAARVAEEYHLPTVVLSIGETESKGSARSVNGLDIVETIRKCSDLLIDIGGHPKAAGFTIDTSKILDFKKKLEGLVKEVVYEDMDELLVEAEVSSKQLTKELVKELEQLEPTGVGNLRVILASQNVRISDIKTVGEGKHLKFKGDGMEAIAFSLGQLASLLEEGQLVNLAYYLEINKFNGQEKLQLKVVELQV
ncbi:MAG: single-stranded-DNA-specific exonuclease RecJ [bacterium]|nr:single-stranded-DNA-specific exonuclease RecJ [bacterium]